MGAHLNLEVALNFVYALMPKKYQHQLDTFKLEIVGNGPVAFCSVNEQACAVISGKDPTPYSIRELAVLFYMWGVAASYASLDGFVAEASRQVREKNDKPPPPKVEASVTRVDFSKRKDH